MWALPSSPDGGNDDCAAALCRVALALDTDLKTLLALIAAQNRTAPRVACLARRAERNLSEAGVLLDEICALLGGCRPKVNGTRTALACAASVQRTRSTPSRAAAGSDSMSGTGIATVRARYARLTAREKEVFRLITAHDIDTSSKGIARRLEISPRTVECHRAKVMKKMAARSIPELVTMAGICGVSPLLLGFGLVTAARIVDRDDAMLRGATAP